MNTICAVFTRANPMVIVRSLSQIVGRRSGTWLPARCLLLVMQAAGHQQRGEINPDIVISDPDPVPVFGEVERLVGSIRMTVGSSSAIFACGAARLELRVAFCGVVGDDVFGRFMLDEMVQRGIDISACTVDADPERVGQAVENGPCELSLVSCFVTCCVSDLTLANGPRVGPGDCTSRRRRCSAVLVVAHREELTPRRRHDRSDCRSRVLAA